MPKDTKRARRGSRLHEKMEHAENWPSWHRQMGSIRKNAQANEDRVRAYEGMNAIFKKAREAFGESTPHLSESAKAARKVPKAERNASIRARLTKELQGLGDSEQDKRRRAEILTALMDYPPPTGVKGYEGGGKRLRKGTKRSGLKRSGLKRSGLKRSGLKRSGLKRKTRRAPK